MSNFWITNPTILIDKYWVILPNNNMTRSEQMNAVTRFCVYFILLCLIFDSQNQFIIYAFVIIILIVVFYLIYMSDQEGFKNDLIKRNNDDSLEKFQDIKNLDHDNNTINKPLINLFEKTKDKVSMSNKNIEIQSGYIDSNGYYQIGKDYSDVNLTDFIINNKKNKKVSWEQDQLNKKEGRKPSLDNPYNNILFSDYTDASNLAEPCNIDDKDVKEMQNLYNSSIYRNIDDVYERENSQRLFYTVPIQTVPNDQTNFANWLYKTGPSCKENSQNCTYYEDPRMTSPRY